MNAIRIDRPNTAQCQRMLYKEGAVVDVEGCVEVREKTEIQQC